MNDYAYLLNASQTQQLERMLADFEQRTSNQVVVLTVPSLDGETVEGYSIQVAEKWKIGQAGKDNGVILLVAPKERKARIEVGYGLEGALTDAESGRIMRGVIVPAFKRGSYFEGILGGASAIMEATQGEYKGDPRAMSRQRRSNSTASTIMTLLIFGIVIFTRVGRMFWPGFFLFSALGGGRRGGGGFGGFSGGGGGFGGGGASGSW